jgi:uroporphyrin-III C-methyltransferase
VSAPFEARAGHVYLVGAGPGDPGLLTLKAHDLLASCGCVLYDQLVDPGVLAFVRPEAERIAVGKVGHGPQTAQPWIEHLMIARARRGLAVVRLKGGCPTLFGRLGEEAMALRGAAIPYEIVPGVTSALAVPAYAGIPLTHRGLAASLAIVTGHCADRGQRPLRSLAHADTLVILMGARSLAEVVAELLAAGRPPDTPAAFLSRGTSRDQQAIRAPLVDLCRAVARSNAGAPAVIVVGGVAALGERLSWFRPDIDEFVGETGSIDRIVV